MLLPCCCHVAAMLPASGRTERHALRAAPAGSSPSPRRHPRPRALLRRPPDRARAAPVQPPGVLHPLLGLRELRGLALVVGGVGGQPHEDLLPGQSAAFDAHPSGVWVHRNTGCQPHPPDTHTDLWTHVVVSKSMASPSRETSCRAAIEDHQHVALLLSSLDASPSPMSCRCRIARTGRGPAISTSWRETKTAETSIDQIVSAVDGTLPAHFGPLRNQNQSSTRESHE